MKKMFVVGIIISITVSGCAPKISRGHENIVLSNNPFNWIAPFTAVRGANGSEELCYWGDPAYEKCVVEGGAFRSATPFGFNGYYVPGSSLIGPGSGATIPVIPVR